MNHNAQIPFDWSACVAALTPEQATRLAEWRGYAPKFVASLRTQNLIGLFEGERIALPVHNDVGLVVGCHYRVKEDASWRFHPTGTRTAPLIVGDLAHASTVFVFESQWDMFATLDAYHWHIQPPDSTAAIATRGASNAKLVAGLCRQDAKVYVFAQNDTPGQKWLTAAAAATGCKCFQVITPEPHKDMNDWTRAGATRQDIVAAIAAAQPIIPASTVDLHISVVPDDEGDDTSIAPFPIECFPAAMGGIVAAVARSERVPVSLPAICALGVTGAAVGAGLEIASAEGRVTRANVFVLGGGESGSGKSQVFRHIAEPFIEHQHQLYEAFQEKTAPEVTSEIGLLTREIKRLEAKAAKESADPISRERLLGELQEKNAHLTGLKQMSMSPCVICGDVTSEKLAVLLAANHETMFSASPEARQIVEIVYGRYAAGNATDEAIYLAGFSGDFVRVDRLGRDPITLRAPCLSVLWLVQPDVLDRLFKTESLAQSGFLPRFLTCQTRATPKKIIAGEAQAVSYTIRKQWAGLVAGLLATYHVAEKPYRIEPSPEAKHLLDEFFNAIVDRRDGDLSDIGQFASRYGEQAWRVALAFHAALYGIDAHNHAMDAETAQNAITVVQWFIAAQLEVLARGRRQAAAKVEDDVLKLIDARIQGRNLEPNERELGRRIDWVTPRSLVRARMVATAEAGRALLDRMERAGLLIGEDITPQGGGKTTRIYRRNTNPVPE